MARQTRRFERSRNGFARGWLATVLSISGAVVALGGTFAGGHDAAKAVAVITEARSVSAFEELELSGVGTLTLKQGETESLRISAEADVLAKISSEVADKRLTIEPTDSFETDEPVTYELTVKDLTTIVLDGSAEIEGEEFETEHKTLTLELEGSTTMKLDKLTADELVVTIDGSAELELAGTVERQEIELGGTATYLAEKLESKEATIKADGSSEATLNVSDTLEAEVGGSATVEYRGDPTVREDVSGVGTLEKLD